MRFYSHHKPENPKQGGMWWGLTSQSPFSNIPGSWSGAHALRNHYTSYIWRLAWPVSRCHDPFSMWLQWQTLSLCHWPITLRDRCQFLPLWRMWFPLLHQALGIGWQVESTERCYSTQCYLTLCFSVVLRFFFSPADTLPLAHTKLMINWNIFSHELLFDQLYLNCYI